MMLAGSLASECVRVYTPSVYKSNLKPRVTRTAFNLNSDVVIVTRAYVDKRSANDGKLLKLKATLGI
jgi:hypothetical protein